MLSVRLWRKPGLAPVTMALLLTLVAGCGQGGESTDKVMTPIEGTVSYRERMMPPPGSVLEIQLQDISIADAPAQVISTLEQPVQGGPPYSFTMDFDPASIEARHTYSLRATIRRGDALVFTTTEYIDPFSGPVQIMLTKVARSSPDKPADPLADTGWHFVELLGEAVPETVNGQPVSLQFVGEGNRAAGYSGCNRYTGVYSRSGRANDGAPLNFGAMAGTRMACAEGMDIEARINELFGSVSAFRMDGDDLLLVGNSEVLARLVPLVES